MDDGERATELKKKILEQHRRMLEEQAQNERQMQARFLEARQGGLEQMAGLILLQAEAADGAAVGAGSSQTGPAKPVYTRQQLEEFASGDVVKCLGPEYAVYEGRRTPRIPNGELLLMSRVLSIQGERFHPGPGAEIVVEYDVPAEAWFYRDNNYPSMPYSVYMEIALQPCGFLSAHLGTQLMFPEEDYYFRNLDGEGRIVKLVDLRGKTITTRARLEKTMVSGKQIIQKFDFQLLTEGQPIFEGNAVFGFFPPDAMANQMGRDGGQETRPLFEQTGRGSLTGTVQVLNESSWYQGGGDKPFYRLPGGYLDFLGEVFISPDGGRERKGYAYANKPVDGRDWFYACHFFQDPVMPGSLGVEAILEAMQAFALQMDLGRDFRSPRFDLVSEHTIGWKYRGQILPTHKMMKLEVQLTRSERQVGQVLLVGDASLWADGIRIYEVKDAAIRLVEGYDGQ
jgi:3-hydroxymyristoyl/3-hydroxydecanoyl-(acyl carrier protein) dehydratase